MAPLPEDEEQGESGERRKELRWNIPIPVRVSGRREDGTEFEEQTITADASPSGMCILLTVRLREGDRVSVTAPEEKFESPATVTDVNPLGPSMHRVRVGFAMDKPFSRTAAKKKYVYDYSWENWVGYISEGTYYNSKHEPFGKIQGLKILSLASGDVLFTIGKDRVFDVRGKCIGHII